MLRRCELRCELNTEILRTKELIVTQGGRGTTGWFFYHKLLHHVKRIQKVKMPQALSTGTVFLFDMKGRIEESVVGKQQSCQELRFNKGHCYVSSRHSMKPQKLRWLTPLCALIQ